MEKSLAAGVIYRINQARGLDPSQWSDFLADETGVHKKLPTRLVDLCRPCLRQYHAKGARQKPSVCRPEPPAARSDSLLVARCGGALRSDASQVLLQLTR